MAPSIGDGEFCVLGFEDHLAVEVVEGHGFVSAIAVDDGRGGEAFVGDDHPALDADGIAVADVGWAAV